MARPCFSSEPSGIEQVNSPEGLENPTRAHNDTLPIIEEELVVEKSAVSDGRVVVSTNTDVVKELAEIQLEGNDVSVERVPINVIVDAAPDVRVEGDVTIVPVLEERLVVEKRLVLVEEIRITNRKTIRTERVEAELRKQSALVERTNLEANEEKPNG
jgi:uncharacterized protein (TIGR02271 family)